MDRVIALAARGTPYTHARRWNKINIRSLFSRRVSKRTSLNGSEARTDGRLHLNPNSSLFLVMNTQVQLSTVGRSLRAVTVNWAFADALAVLRRKSLRASGIARNHANERQQKGDEPQELHLCKRSRTSETL